jgi:transcriptional regulator with XRE-family HTH domain
MRQNRIREYRMERGLTIDQLAELVGVSQPHMGRLERGERDLLVPVAEKIGQALNRTTVEILGFEPEDGGLAVVALAAGLDDEARMYEHNPGDPLGGLQTATRQLWTCETDALDNLRIFRSDVLIVETDGDVLRKIAPLDAVLVRWPQPDAGLKPVLLLRQFIPPRLLISNSSRANVVPLDLDDTVIIGVIKGAHRRMG